MMRLSLGPLSQWTCAAALTACIIVAASFSLHDSARWQLLSTGDHPHTPAFLSVSFSDPDHGWGLTPKALFETVDGGRNWVPRIDETDEKRTFFSLEFVDPMTGFIVGSQHNGTEHSLLILRTDDAGQSWQDSDIKVKSEKRALLQAVSFCDPQVGWAAGSAVILKTTDGGQSWETRRSNPGEVFYSIACQSFQRVWAVGQNGLIVNTTDGGETWQQQPSGTSESLTRIRVVDDALWIVGGLGGKAFYSIAMVPTGSLNPLLILARYSIFT
jgi:photosystem II stability/assembly factor-like uncharacterized protein